MLLCMPISSSTVLHTLLTAETQSLQTMALENVMVYEHDTLHASCSLTPLTPAVLPAHAAGNAATAGGGAAATAAQAANSVRPAGFKSLVGRGHPEFSSARQQDAAEFFGYVLELLNRAEHANAGRLGIGSSDAAAQQQVRVCGSVRCILLTVARKLS